jgi:TolB-like protein
LKSLKQDLEFADKLRQSGASSPTGASQSEFKGIESATSGTQSPVTVASGVVSGLRKHLLLFALVLILGGGITAYLLLTRSSKSQRIQSLAVLPFVNESGNPDVDYLSDGLSDLLINNLSKLPQLSVKARSAVFRYKNKELDPQQVASELSVQAVVNGRVVQRGDNLTLYLSLIDGRTGNQIWGDQYDRKMIDLVALQRQITGDVSQKLRAQIAPADERKLTKTYTANSDAYQLYLKGRYHYAYVHLSDSYAAKGMYDDAAAQYLVYLKLKGESPEKLKDYGDA